MEETLELLVVKEAHSCSAQQRTQGTTSVITMTGFGDVKIIFVYRGKKKSLGCLLALNVVVSPINFSEYSRKVKNM